MFGAQMLLMVLGCLFPSAASVVVGFVEMGKPIVGLVVVVGRSLGEQAHAVLELEVCLALRPAFGSLLG